MHTTTSPSLDRLRTTLEAFFAKLERLSYQDLRQQQEVPWASLTDGISANTYCLIHGLRTRSTSVRIATAHQLLERTLAEIKDRSALYFTDVPGEQGLDTAFYGSKDSLDYMRLILGSLDVDSRRIDVELTSFLDSIDVTTPGPTEVMFGLAGYLNAVTHIQKWIPNPPVAQTADRIAHALLERGKPNLPWRWTLDENLNFSHGRSGTFHALLNWSIAFNRELPGWFFEELELLATATEASGTWGVPPDLPYNLRRSWCRGSAGHAMLWARAYEHSGLERYRHRAWEASAFSHTGINNAHGSNNLCCGLGGRAYALLAMDRIAPGCGWYEKALEMGDLAIRHDSPFPEYFKKGLYRGLGGLMCLAMDLLANPGDRAGYPLIEG